MSHSAGSENDGEKFSDAMQQSLIKILKCGSTSTMWPGVRLGTRAAFPFDLNQGVRGRA